jgi:hypothetical protein
LLERRGFEPPVPFSMDGGTPDPGAERSCDLGLLRLSATALRKSSAGHIIFEHQTLISAGRFFDSTNRSSTKREKLDEAAGTSGNHPEEIAVPKSWP